MATGGEAGNPNEPPPNHQQLSWEGDRMFNIYIYDYCYKRGFHKTASALMGEADIPADSQPPINANQGLLFEWWTVFWVLFQAKSSGTGSDDAMIYTQHQVQRQQQVRMASQPPIARMTNGIPRPGPHMNGQIPNGIPNGVPPGPGGMQNATPGAPFPGGPQLNGISGAPGAPGGPGGQNQPPNMQQMLQRPNPATAGQQPNAAPGMSQMGPSQPLTQMNSRGNMFAPNGNTLGRSPSQPGSPAQNGLHPSPSPSMAARQPPGMYSGDIRHMESQILNDLFRMPQDVLQRIRQEAGISSDKELLSMTPEERSRVFNLVRTRGLRPGQQGPPAMNNAAAGPSSSTPGQHGQQRNQQTAPNQQVGPQQRPQPPAQAQQQTQLHAQQQAQHAQQQAQQQQAQQQQQRVIKRSSTSPEQEQEQLPRNDSSPPDRKRQRRSPNGAEQQPPAHPNMTSLAPFSHQPQQGAPGPSQLQNGVLRGLPGFPGQQGMSGMGNNQNMNVPMGGAPMLNQGMMNSNAMLNPQMASIQYRQSMVNVHNKNGHPHGAIGLPGPPGSSSSSDGQFNMDAGAQPRPPVGQFPGGPGPGPAGPNRLGPNKVMGGMMPPPPPSPSMNPARKQDGPNGDTAPNGRLDASPQNAAAGQPPAPGGGSSTAPPTPNASNSGMTAASPSAILNNSSTPSMAPSHPPPSLDNSADMFPAGFLQDDFDPSIFRTDGELNFERDFGEWFNSDNVMGNPIE